MVDDVISQIKGSLELWPTLIEIVYFYKDRQSLPKVLVRNRRKKSDARGVRPEAQIERSRVAAETRRAAENLRVRKAG
jgi:hypothetical protein